MACFDPAVQERSCYLNNPREKVDQNFDNAFQLVDLWLANETTFEKTKDKIQVAVKDKDLDLIEKCIFYGSTKSCCNEISLVNTKVFFSFDFLPLYLFSFVLMESTSGLFIAQISFFKTNFPKLQLLNFPPLQPERKKISLTWKHCNLPNKMIWLQITITTKYQRINTQLMKIKTNKQTRVLEEYL